MSTDNKPLVVITIPCYNEGDRLSVKTIETFLDESDNVHFVFVDDGSSDATHPLLAEIREYAPGRVHILSREVNEGKSAAVRRGVEYSLQHTSADYVGFWDADLSAPLTEVWRFRDFMSRHPDVKLVMGARLKRLGADVRRKAWRHYLGRGFATLASVVVGLAVYDTQCGAKLFTRELAEKVFEEPFRTQWCFDLEIMCRSREILGEENVHRQVYEMPLTQWIHQEGSKVKFRHAPMIAVELLKVWRIARRVKQEG